MALVRCLEQYEKIVGPGQAVLFREAIFTCLGHWAN